MIEFKLSVPNKISLFGEHTLPFRYSGVAAGIELRTTISFAELSDVNKIVIMFPQIDLYFDKPLTEFLDIYNTCILNEDKRETWHEQISQYITASFNCVYYQKIILEAFFYLLICIAEKEKICIKSFKIYLSTQLKIDTVFPCPSSFAVCFAASFLYWSRLQKGVVQNNFTNDDLKKIQCTASLCTKISSKFQEVDTIVCTYGSTITHRKTYMEGRATNWAIFNMPVMTVLLVDSYQQQSLERQLQEITIKSTINPDGIERRIARLNDQTIIAMKILDDISFIKGNFQLNATTRFGRLIDQQQRLKTVGIAIQELLDSLISHSHRTLRNISLIAQKHNMFAKCTDIGDSRYAYVLCAMYVSKQIMAISSDLEEAGFGVTKTTFSKVGLKIETGLDF